MRFDIKQLEQTASTNDDARQAAENGAPAGTVIWALRQSAGRGRQGRVWESPEGNLYCSIVLRPAIERGAWGLYSFVAALAIADTMRGFLPSAPIELKWPNDVLVGGKKISGLLLEAGENFLIVGIGLNIRHSPENPLYPATSLAAEGAGMLQAEVVLDELLAALGRWAERLEKQGFAPIRDAWLAHARKGALRVRLPDAEIQGEFAGLDEQGRLQLRLADRTICVIASGDVFF
ncbi:MAG: biotin--[acetyl-CoA-carboxylase] ligase [Alphaproteobacteria bacterium]|nr:biotin--[acetyl-CoA-carboxylase] ligase [Alphaproteobacteria bacterium]